MKEHILVVDDNVINLKILSTVLKGSDYQVSTATSGREAFKVIESNAPDLILLDIMIPDIDGYDMCRTLKSNEETKDIPIIFVTALVEKENKIKGLNMGAEDYITKPFYKEEILLRIRTQLDLSNARKGLEKTIEDQSLLLDHIDTLVWYLKDSKTLGKVNESFASFLNRKREDVENAPIREVIAPEELEETIRSNNRVFENGEKINESHWVRNGFGEKRLLAITKTPKVNEHGIVEYVVSSAEDITEKNMKEEKIRYLSYHDALTGLYNREFFDEELRRLDVKRNIPLSIMICDVNGLKLANDIFGHKKGDELLIEAGKILKKMIREDDIIARWGGDEFTILLPGTPGKDAEKIMNRIRKESKTRNVEPMPLSIAVGLATKSRLKQDITAVIKKAEDRMYRDKIKTKEKLENPLFHNFVDKFYGKEYSVMQHTEEIHRSAELLGPFLQLNKTHLEKLKLLVKIHDLGKISIPKHILNKGEELTETEWEHYKTHVEVGFRIANTFPSLQGVAEEVLHHHEHFDGTGFPNGLKGREIPFLARVMYVLDFYDGLRGGLFYPVTQTTFYMKPLSVEETVEEMKKHKGTCFDPEILDIFLQKVVPELDPS